MLHDNIFTTYLLHLTMSVILDHISMLSLDTTGTVAKDFVCPVFIYNIHPCMSVPGDA
jgi:hypothetical protein